MNSMPYFEVCLCSQMSSCCHRPGLLPCMSLRRLPSLFCRLPSTFNFRRSVNMNSDFHYKQWCFSQQQQQQRYKAVTMCNRCCMFVSYHFSYFREKTNQFKQVNYEHRARMYIPSARCVGCVYIRTWETISKQKYRKNHSCWQLQLYEETVMNDPEHKHPWKSQRKAWIVNLLKFKAPAYTPTCSVTPNY